MAPFDLATLVRYGVARSSTLAPPEALGYEYIIARNGIFLRATNLYVTATMLVHSLPPTTLRGVADITPSICLHHPRLPSELLYTTLADARTHTNSAGAFIEVLYFFTLQSDVAGAPTFSVTKPAQAGSVGSVTHQHPLSEVAPHPARVLLELHTHGALAAFWSATDNRDEQGFRFYAVVGNVDSEAPTIRLRLGIYGYFWEVPLTTLFDLPDAPTDALSFLPRSPEEVIP